jgi:ABC-type Na+ efflux pump permease subunit
MSSDPSPAPERFSFLFALFALSLGVACGALHVLVETMEQPDPLLSALAVTMATMLLGVLRPARPWRWVLLVGVPVPLALLVASLVRPDLHFERAAIAGSLLILLPGFAGGFGGSVLRRKVEDLFAEEKPTPAPKS